MDHNINIIKHIKNKIQLNLMLLNDKEDGRIL